MQIELWPHIENRKELCLHGKNERKMASIEVELLKYLF